MNDSRAKGLRTKNKAALRDAFHAAGMRLTRQRSAIYNELRGRFDHPDVESLFRAVKPRIPQLSLFTVYRTVNALESAGLVWRVATWKGHARYDGHVEAHAHFLCETCSRLDDVDTRGACHGLREHAKGCVSGEVRRVDILIAGECEECARRRMPVREA